MLIWRCPTPNSRRPTKGAPRRGPNLAGVTDETIGLGQYLKLVAHTGTGGEAKILIQQGHVRVNGEVEIRRGRKLVPGDRVEVDDQVFVVGEES